MTHPSDVDTFPNGPPSEQHELLELAEAMRELAERATHTDGPEALQELVSITIERIPEASWASLTFLSEGKFSTQASTDDAAVRADILQYRIGAGPAVDAVHDGGVYVTGDVAADPRWGEWGQRVQAEVGVRSVMTQRLHLHDDSGVIAALNIYSDQPDVFTDQAVGVGLVLATHGALLVTAMQAEDESSNLRVALESNREIGVAVGVLMTVHHVTQAQAFDLLRAVSQHTNRKLTVVAQEVADTGTLTMPAPARRPSDPTA